MNTLTPMNWRWASVAGLLAVFVGWGVQRIGLQRYDTYSNSNPTLGLVIFWLGAILSVAGIAVLVFALFKIARSSESSVERTVAWVLFGTFMALIVIPILTILALAVGTT